MLRISKRKTRGETPRLQSFHLNLHRLLERKRQLRFRLELHLLAFGREHRSSSGAAPDARTDECSLPTAGYGADRGSDARSTANDFRVTFLGALGFDDVGLGDDRDDLPAVRNPNERQTHAG